MGNHPGYPETCSPHPKFRAVEVRLIDDDYRLLVSWRGRCTLSTYLTVVLVRLMRDYRTSAEGRVESP